MQNTLTHMLQDTLSIFESGKYTKNGKTIRTKFSKSQLEECHVFLPEDINSITHRKDFDHIHYMGQLGVGCANMDSFSMAQLLHKQKILFLEKIPNPFLY